MRMNLPLKLRTAMLAGLGVFAVAPSAVAQLFDNLQTMSTRVRVGSPEVRSSLGIEGPKGVVLADFDADGNPDFATSNSDGTVSVAFGTAGRGFELPEHLLTGGVTLREIAVGDVVEDGRPDIVVADPIAGSVTVFENLGAQTFAAATLTTWTGARNFVLSDLDGDGHLDIVAGGRPVGVRLYRGDGLGGFIESGSSSALLETERVAELIEDEDEGVSRPVFNLRALPSVDGMRVVVSHAYADAIYFYETDASGELVATETLTDIVGDSMEDLHHFELASVAVPNGGDLDLVAASKLRNSVIVWRSTGTAGSFDSVPYQSLRVEGGPRAVRLRDIDGDGWNDLIVVQRYFNRLSLFRNESGTFTPWDTIPTGASPRDVEVGDLDGDGKLDFCVANRDSHDVSTLYGDSGAVVEFPTRLYEVDGEVGGLSVQDLSGDGLDDVVQMHRATGDVSVRLSLPGGRLGGAAYYPMGVGVSQVSLADADDDGIADLSTANLGAFPGDGSFSYRSGDGAGGFGDLVSVSLPPTAGGRIFAIRYGDFDGDGIIDLAAGYYDCRVTFFKGDGAGGFSALSTHYFVSESRLMATGDFDGDGDIDLAGAGAAGSVVVFENVNNGMMTAEEGTIPRDSYILPTHRKPGVRRLDAKDLNDDGDLDLFLVTAGDVFVFHGAAGMSFDLSPEPLLVAEGDLDGNPPEFGAAPPTIPRAPIGISAAAVADFDNNGTDDLATGCQDASCIQIAIKTGNRYEVVLTVDVPSSELLATGDLDGDGLPDLVGSGEILWVAYSGTPPVPTTEIDSSGSRGVVDSVVINELLAVNDFIRNDETGTSGKDLVELYNGTQSDVSLAGWKVRLEKFDDSGAVAETKDYTLPPGTMIETGSHRVVLFAEEPLSELTSGYKLPGSGGRLSLIDSGGTLRDSVTYSEQEADTSFARYRDGFESFVFNPYPDLGGPNLDNGGLGPSSKLTEITPLPAPADDPLRLFARGSDDQGIESMSIVFRRLDKPTAMPVRVALFDDGQNGDGANGDGLFSGLLPPLEDGAQIEFYLETVDLTGEIDVDPAMPRFTSPGAPILNYTLVVGSANAAPDGLEVSEIVASNGGQVLDPAGDLDDWIELRNTGGSDVSLEGLALFQKYFAAGASREFDGDEILPAGGYRMLWADKELGEGVDHLPFRIDADGEMLFVGRRTALGAMAVVSALETPELSPEQSYARMGQGGEFRVTTPTPASQNVNGEIEIWHGPGPGEVSVLYRTSLGGSDFFEWAGADGVWTPEGTGGTGVGVEELQVVPIEGTGLFRVRRE